MTTMGTMTAGATTEAMDLEGEEGVVTGDGEGEGMGSTLASKVVATNPLQNHENEFSSSINERVRVLGLNQQVQRDITPPNSKSEKARPPTNPHASGS